MKQRKLYDGTNFENLKEIIEGAVNKYPNNIAFKIKDKGIKESSYLEITYEKFYKDIKSLATYFLKNNSERIAIVSPNRYEWAVAYFAALFSGNVVIPLDKGLTEVEIDSLVKRSYADTIVYSKEYIEVIEGIKNAGESKLSKFIQMEDFKNYLDDLDEKMYNLVEINSEKNTILIFTSGTTSASKAVMLSQKNIASNINAMNACEKLYDTDVNMAFLPLHHTFGSTGLILMLSKGACNVFCDGLRYIQKNLVEYKVSVFICVPLLIESMYKKIVKEIEKQGKTKTIEKGIKISNFLLKFGIDIRRKIFKQILDKFGGNLRFIVSGAAGIDKNVAKAFNDFGILTVQGYGLTETSPVLSAENEKCIKYGSVGVPLINVEMKIDNPNENGIGEIIARGPNLMEGYFENEEATKEAIVDGWFHTGDLGYQDKDGCFFITGRKKNVIVLKNGKNIFPEELETLVGRLPYVEESMVFGLPKGDDLLVSVKIVYNKEYIDENFKDISKEDLHEMIWKDIKNINLDLSTYKHIKYLIVTDEPMIKTTTAKIKRFEEIKKILENRD